MTVDCWQALVGIASCAFNDQKFRCFFFNSKMARPNDREFILWAKFAHFLTWCECLHLFDDLPFNVEVDVFVFLFFF